MSADVEERDLLQPEAVGEVLDEVASRRRPRTLATSRYADRRARQTTRATAITWRAPPGTTPLAMGRVALDGVDAVGLDVGEIVDRVDGAREEAEDGGRRERAPGHDRGSAPGRRSASVTKTSLWKNIGASHEEVLHPLMGPERLDQAAEHRGRTLPGPQRAVGRWGGARACSVRQKSASCGPVERLPVGVRAPRALHRRRLRTRQQHARPGPVARCNRAAWRSIALPLRAILLDGARSEPPTTWFPVSRPRSLLARCSRARSPARHARAIGTRGRTCADRLAEARGAPRRGDQRAGPLGLRRAARGSGASGTGDPAEVEEVLRDVAADPRCRRPVRAYAGLLEAYARRRRGDLDGARARMASLGYVGAWMVVGPFDNEGKAGFERAVRPRGASASCRSSSAHDYDGKEHAGPLAVAADGVALRLARLRRLRPARPRQAAATPTTFVRDARTQKPSATTAAADLDLGRERRRGARLLERRRGPARRQVPRRSTPTASPRAVTLRERVEPPHW